MRQRGELQGGGEDELGLAWDVRRNKKVNPGRDVQGLGGGVERAWEPRARTAVRKERVLWAVRKW